MIIRLTKANFSENNIGELNKFTITCHGTGLASSEFTSPIDKGATATIKVTLNSGFSTSDIKVTMKGDPISPDISSTGTNEYTITIPNVTGRIVVLVGEASSGGGEVEPDSSSVFDFDFTANTIDDYSLEDIFTVPDNSTTSAIEYDATYGMSLNSNLPNGLNLVNPIDASKPWELEFIALFVTPTVLAGNRRAFLGGNDLYPFVFINGATYDNMGFQISNGTHATLYGKGVLAYDKEATYKINYDGNGKVYVTVDGVEKGNVSVNFAGQQFTVILGNVKGKSTAYVWQNVEEGKKSYLKKLKFKYV
jgi:hypothetical protein